MTAPGTTLPVSSTTLPSTPYLYWSVTVLVPGGRTTDWSVAVGSSGIPSMLRSALYARPIFNGMPQSSGTLNVPPLTVSVLIRLELPYISSSSSCSTSLPSVVWTWPLTEISSKRNSAGTHGDASGLVFQVPRSREDSLICQPLNWAGGTTDIV